ncbi:WD40/YVTN/BNR-like repeat-containing protein [Shewanella maritima]|uniref:WD40/YVTN/BNR-like repeat-containing protein n=1 Tax=Shewanella maritima TaxID=2520507 RepID=UPI003736163C
MSFSILRSAVLVGLGLIAHMPAHAELDPLAAQIQPLAKSSLVLDIATTGKQLVAVGQRGHVLIKQQDWQQVATPVIAQLTKTFFINDTHGWAVGHDATIIHTQDGGMTWQLQMQSPDIEKPFLDVMFFDPQHGIAVGAYGLFYRTSDGGQNWQEEFHEELLFEEDVAYLAELKLEDEALYLSEKSALLPHFNRVVKLSDGRILMVGELGTVTISDNQGKHFDKVEFDYDGSMFTAIEYQNNIYVMGLRGHVFKTDHTFSQWQEIELPVESSINGAFETTDGRLLLVGNAGSIIEIKDNTAALLARRQGENIVAVAADVQGQLWFAGSKGLFQLQD